MSEQQATVLNLQASIKPESDGIISRTVFQDDRFKTVLFGFGAGQELSEHTASKPAVMHFLSGEADVTVGSEKLTATPGAWVHMPAAMPHSIVAKTPTVMLLYLLK